MDRVSILRPDDWHGHMRQAPQMWRLVPLQAPYGRLKAMPNTVPPRIKAADVVSYLEELRIQGDFHRIGTQFIGVLYLTPSTTRQDIEEAAKQGVVDVKVYPKHGTTNSDYGIEDYAAIDPDIIAAMAENNMRLCLHGEHPHVAEQLDREAAFLEILDNLATLPQRPTIILEHVTTAAAVERVEYLDDVYGTITAHHLYLTHDQVMNPFQPHHLCMPIAKHETDRQALIEAAITSDSFFFGSDSAPHPPYAKTNDPDTCKAGVFVPASVALPLLAQVFETASRRDWVRQLESFTSRRGALIHGLPPNPDQIQLVQQQWTVPETIAGIVPFMAGRTLSWQLEEEAA